MALHIKEREIMENHNATLNSLCAYTTEEENIEKNNKHKSEKIICECGSKVCRSVISRHIKSTKHFKLMESVVNQI